MAMTLKIKTNHPNASVQTKKSTTSSVKCEGFAHCFLRFQWRGASWILARRRSIRNITLKLYADSAKQFVGNGQNCWKTNHGFCNHDNEPAHTHRCLNVSFWPKTKKKLIMPQPPYTSDLAPVDFFLFRKLKTPMKGKRFAAIEEIKEKSKEELLAISKSVFQKCFQDWKKRWHRYIISDRVLWFKNKPLNPESEIFF